MRVSPFTRTLVIALAAAGCSAPNRGPNALNTPAATSTMGTARADRPGVETFGERGRFEIEAMEKLVLHDAKRGKDLQLRLTFPRGVGRHPLIVWSHGAGGSKDNYQPIVTHWASHGYVVIQPTHSDSRALGTKIGDALRFQDWPSRPADVSFVLDSLDEVERQVTALAGRIDRGAVGVGGHSFGANTAQLIGGAKAYPAPGRVERSFADARVAAVMLLSGQGVGEMLRRESWADFRRPMFVMTGSADGPTRTGQPAVWRKQPYELSPPGDKYLVWVDDLDHGFGGITGVSFNPRNKPNADHVAWTKFVTLAFWEAYLAKHDAARAWLRSNGLAAMSQGSATIEHK